MAIPIPTRKGYLAHGENGVLRSVENAWGRHYSANRIMIDRILQLDPFQKGQRFNGDWTAAIRLADYYA